MCIIGQILCCAAWRVALLLCKHPSFRMHPYRPADLLGCYSSGPAVVALNATNCDNAIMPKTLSFSNQKL